MPMVYIEWIHSNVYMDILYSSGNYIQYPIINHNRKEFFLMFPQAKPRVSMDPFTVKGSEGAGDPMDLPSLAWLSKSSVIQPSLLLHLQPSSLPPTIPIFFWLLECARLALLSRPLSVPSPPPIPPPPALPLCPLSPVSPSSSP